MEHYYIKKKDAKNKIAEAQCYIQEKIATTLTTGEAEILINYSQFVKTMYKLFFNKND